MTTSTDATLGSAGRMPAAGLPARPDLPPTAGTRQGRAVGVGWEPVIPAVDSAPAPPLPDIARGQERATDVSPSLGERRGQAPPDAAGGRHLPRLGLGDDAAGPGRRPSRYTAAWGHLVHLAQADLSELDLGRTWSVVVLDADGDPEETVTGFSSLDAADAYAMFSRDITRWTSVPSRPGIPRRIPRL